MHTTTRTRGAGAGQTRRATAGIALAAGLVLAACGGDRAPSARSAALVRDSAGIRIVENVGPTWAPDEVWTVAPEPRLEIGVLDGPASLILDGVRTPRLRSDGGVVLANGGTGEVRSYAGDGTLAWRSGGFGEGPGEFRSVSWLDVLPGDSVIVWDVRARRVTVLAPDGALARSYGAEPPQNAPMAAPTGVLDGDRLLISGGVSFSSNAAGTTDEAVWPESPHFVGDRRGGLGRRLVTVRTTEMRLQRTPGSVSIGDLPFARRGFVTAAGDRVVTGASPEATLTWFDLDGRPMQVARWPHEARPVDDALVEAWVQGRLAENDEPQVRRYYRELVEGVALPERVPGFTALRVDDRGHAWVKQWRAPGATGAAPWWVFSPEGVLLGQVELPDGLEVSEITATAVVGVARDDLGVERVRIHALAR
jgi:hypothetical protein